MFNLRNRGFVKEIDFTPKGATRNPYGMYLRFIWPLLAILATLTVVVLAVGAYLP
jgi:hypothetical protein